MKVNGKIWFKGEKRPYTIQACDERFLICTKPFNIKHTVQYTIVDLKYNIRGADSYWKWGGWFDYSKREECERCLSALNGGIEAAQPFEISYHNRVELNIVKYRD